MHLALPPGSKPGEGLGAKVARRAAQLRRDPVVLRAFDDGGVAPDPDGDLAALELELVIADLASVEQRLNKPAPGGEERRQGDRRPRSRRSSGRTRCSPTARRSGAGSLTPDDLARLAPVFLPHDQAEPGRAQHRRDRSTTEAAAADPGDECCGADRHRGRDRGVRARGPGRDARDRTALGESALDTVAQAAYHLLGRRTFFTTGEDESRAWTFRAGAKAPECAGVIHSDLQRGFIRAEVIDWQELLEIGSWAKAREQKKLRVEGKDYEVRDGDVLEIRFNV